MLSFLVWEKIPYTIPYHTTVVNSTLIILYGISDTVDRHRHHPNNDTPHVFDAAIIVVVCLLLSPGWFVVPPRCCRSCILLCNYLYTSVYTRKIRDNDIVASSIQYTVYSIQYYTHAYFRGCCVNNIIIYTVWCWWEWMNEWTIDWTMTECCEIRWSKKSLLLF